MVSGYTKAEVIQQLYDSHIISVEDLQKYQRPNPEKGLTDTIKSLAVEDPQHPPLYYIMARFWSQGFGSSPAAMRSLSALISLLTFPFFYWLCLELFGSASVGWLVIALTSVSLFHLMYAQEARPYSLWTVTILLSSAALLRAIRVKTKLSWGIYAASMTLGFYTSPLTGLVLIGHGIYLTAIEQFRLTKTLISYLLASLTGFLAFTPWILIVITNASRQNTAANWLIQDVSLWYLLNRWVLNISYIFVSAKPRVYLPILILVGYSLYFLCCQTSKRIWLFILTLTGSTALTLILADLIIGARISVTNRYLVPFYLGIQLAVAYLFTDRIVLSTSIKIWQKKLWLIVMIALISLGIWTCTRFLQTEKGWNKGDFENLPIARIINQTAYPLVISDSSKLGSLLSLSYLLDSKVKLQLLFAPDISKVPDNFSDVFLFKLTEAQRNQIQKEQKSEIEKVDRGFWKLVTDVTQKLE